jgi:hypothetical protein
MSPHRHLKELGGSETLSAKVLELLRNREEIQERMKRAQKKNGPNHS